jgi:O-antigen/teichoic acid export membrane protein
MEIKLPGLRRNTANFFSTWLLQIGTLLFALVTIPLVIRRFGLEGLGVWLLVQQLASYMQLLELGLGSSLGRFLSRAHALHDSVSYTRYSSTAISILLVMGASLILLAAPIGHSFPYVFKLPAHLILDGTWMLIIAIFATGIMLPLRSALGVLTSQHRFVLIAGVEGTALILRFVLTVAVCVVLEHNALIALSLAVFVPGLMGSLALFVAATRLAPNELFKTRYIDARGLVEMLGVSIAAMAVTLATVLLRQGSAVLTGYSLGMESIALIALPVMLVVSLGPFFGIANQLISPVASQLDAVGRVDILRSIYLNAARYTLAIGLLMFTGITLAAPHLIPLWLGESAIDPQHANLIYLNLVLVFGGYCIAIPAFLARSVLISVGRHKVVATGELFSAITGLTVGWVLMNIFNLGVTGMACGIFVAYMIRGCGNLLRQFASNFDMRLHRLFFEIWRVPLIVNTPLVLVFIPGFSIDDNLYIGFMLIGLALSLWIWLAFKYLITESHRTKIVTVMFGMLKRKRIT